MNDRPFISWDPAWAEVDVWLVDPKSTTGGAAGADPPPDQSSATAAAAVPTGPRLAVGHAKSCLPKLRVLQVLEADGCRPSGVRARR